MGCRRPLGVWGWHGGLGTCAFGWSLFGRVLRTDWVSPCISKRVACKRPELGVWVVLLACVCRSGCSTVHSVHQSRAFINVNVQACVFGWLSPQQAAVLSKWGGGGACSWAHVLCRAQVWVFMAAFARSHVVGSLKGSEG